ncbi:MAG: CHAT domain-containing protein [Microcoleaceae cyanobacterium]
MTHSEKTYYTYRIRIANPERVQVERRDPENQTMGEPAGVFQYEAEQIKPLLEAAAQNEFKDEKQAQYLGETLFNTLFDPTLRQDFVNFYQQVVRLEKQLLRVELDIDEQGMPAIAALPWELMCLPESTNLGTLWLGTDPNLVFSRRRNQWHAAPPIQLEAGEKLRIALVVSASENLGPVVYEKAQTALEKLAQRQPEQIELLPIVHSATPEKIDQILEQQPHIFHFIGHGRFQDETGKEVSQIALVDDVFDDALWVDSRFFSGLFARHQPGIVLLQACEGGKLSDSQAFVGVASRVVQENIPVVVAMQYEISNAMASRFAYRFYEGLAKNEPVDISVQNGRRAIALNTQYRNRDFATPVILMRVNNGYLFKRDEPELEVDKNSQAAGNVGFIQSGWTVQGDVNQAQRDVVINKSSETFTNNLQGASIGNFANKVQGQARQQSNVEEE